MQVFEFAHQLPDEDQLLLEKAKEAVGDAYAPYSRFRVGSAIRLRNGKIIKGSNQENASFPLCLCAERVAIAAADSNFPREAVVAVAVTAKSSNQVIDKPIAPCGACRQVICETENKHGHDIRIIMQGESGEIYVLQSGKDLLPLSFDGSYL